MKTHTAWNDPMRATENLIRESLASAMDRAWDESVRHATNDALALAWTTPYPWLVLPVLLEEKLAAARRYSERQRSVRLSSQELLRKMGWHGTTVTGSSSAETDRPPPSSYSAAESSARACIWAQP